MINYALSNSTSNPHEIPPTPLHPHVAEASRGGSGGMSAGYNGTHGETPRPEWFHVHMPPLRWYIVANSHNSNKRKAGSDCLPFGVLPTRYPLCFAATNASASEPVAISAQAPGDKSFFGRQRPRAGLPPLPPGPSGPRAYRPGATRPPVPLPTYPPPTPTTTTRSPPSTSPQMEAPPRNQLSEIRG